MAKARPIECIGEDDAFAAVAARVVELRARELIEHAVGVLDTTDIERVHDMRVATRRLRAALEVFEPCFPRKRYKATLREVKALADALGQRRDRDVTLEALDRFADGVGPADRPGVRSLASTLRDEQLQANLGLAPSVAPDRLAGLAERLAELVAAADALVAKPGDEPADQPADEPADQPADEPADQPVDEPADQPEKPVDEPAEERPPGAGRFSEQARAATNGGNPR